MVIQGCDHLVVGSRVEHFLNLLQKALSIESSGTYECILSQQNVLALESRIETIINVIIK